MPRKKKVARNQHDEETEGKPSSSGFDAEFRCLGRRELCATLPPEDDTTIQKRGQRVHKALETSDLSELPASEQITASRCMYAEAELVHKFGFEGAHVEWEMRIWDFDDQLRHTWSARIDALHIIGKGERIMVDDHKTGWGLPIAIEENWQMKSQGALLGDQYASKEVVAALVHPHHPDSLYETVVYGPKEIAENLVIVRGLVAKIQKKGNRRTPNAISCQYCKAKRICPEYQGELKALEQSIADEIEDKGFTAIIRQTPEQRGKRVKQLKSFAKGIKEILEQYTHLAKKDEDAIKGWRLRRSYDRILTSEREAIIMTERAFGKEALREAMEFSLTSLQAFLEKGMTKKEAKARVEEVLFKVLKFQPKEPFLEERRA